MPKRLQRMMVGLAGLILVVVVALQNRHPVQIHILFWALPHVPLVVVVLVAMLVGLLAGALGMWWDLHRRDQSGSIRSVPAPTISPADQPGTIHPPLADKVPAVASGSETASTTEDLASAKASETPMHEPDQPPSKPF